MSTPEPTTATIATPVVPATVEPTTPMKLSEAIRLGSLLTEPLRYSYMQHVGGQTHTCALGAAAYVHGARDRDQAFRWARIHGVIGLQVECPACHVVLDLKYGIVQHLNDQHRWDRPRIADWLEGIGL